MAIRTKTAFLCISFLGAYICGPGPLPGQESLLTKTIKGNSRIIYSVAFSPDGKYLASGGVDNTPKIWSLADGSAVNSFTGHKNFVNSVAFSPDGKKLVSAGEDGAVKIWNAEDGSCLHTLKGHKDSVWSAAFFPDGESVASAGTDGTIKLWRTASGTLYKTLKGHSSYIYSVAISSDGKTLASGSADRTIRIWDAESGARKLTLEGHGGAVNSVAFSRMGNYLVSGSDDGSVKVWRISDGVCIKTFTAGGRPVLAVAYSPDDANVFSGGSDRTVNAWNISRGTLTRTFSGHGGTVKSLALSRDGKYLASGSFDKTIRIWLTPWEADARNGEMRKAEEQEAEKNKNHALHYEAGLQLLAAPSWRNLKKSVEEFRLALSYKQSEGCEAKLKEAVEALGRKEAEIKRTALISLISLLLVSALLAVVRGIFGTKKNARLKRVLPDEIKRETMSGGYEKAFKLYGKYKAIGGEAQNLPQRELLELYRGLQALDELPKEELPYHFFLSYAAAFAKEGNYRTAQSMLRSGRLLDQFEKPADYDLFVEIYEEARRPENMLMIKLEPSAYSGLAEAFFRAKKYDCCEKACALKKQFHPAQLSARDNELLSASQKNRAPADPE